MRKKWLLVCRQHLTCFIKSFNGNFKQTLPIPAVTYIKEVKSIRKDVPTKIGHKGFKKFNDDKSRQFPRCVVDIWWRLRPHHNSPEKFVCWHPIKKLKYVDGNTIIGKTYKGVVFRKQILPGSDVAELYIKLCNATIRQPNKLHT